MLVWRLCTDLSPIQPTTAENDKVSKLADHNRWAVTITVSRMKKHMEFMKNIYICVYIYKTRRDRCSGLQGWSTVDNCFKKAKTYHRKIPVNYKIATTIRIYRHIYVTSPLILWITTAGASEDARRLSITIIAVKTHLYCFGRRELLWFAKFLLVSLSSIYNPC